MRIPFFIFKENINYYFHLSCLGDYVIAHISVFDLFFIIITRFVPGNKKTRFEDNAINTKVQASSTRRTIITIISLKCNCWC